VPSGQCIYNGNNRHFQTSRTHTELSCIASGGHRISLTLHKKCRSIPKSKHYTTSSKEVGWHISSVSRVGDGLLQTL